MWCVGRVVVDAGGEEGGVGGGRLGVGNLALEGSRLASEGARVRLDVSALPPGARFFPGQVGGAACREFAGGEARSH